MMRCAPFARRGLYSRGVPTLCSCLLACALLSLCACGEAKPEAPQSDDSVLLSASLGPASLSLRGSAGPFRFGERVRLCLEVRAESDAELLSYPTPARLGHLRVRRTRVISETPSILKVEWEVDAERAGENLLILPAPRFRVQKGEGEGTTGELLTDAVRLDFAALSTDERPDLTRLAAPFDPLPWTSERRYPLWPIGALLATIVASIWWIRSRRQTEKAVVSPPVDPELEAATALDRLLATDLLDREEYGLFYVELTRIVRVFLERTTGIQAEDLTTEEFLDAARRETSAISPTRRMELEGFLEASDLIKFAGQTPARPEILAAVEAARRFCRRQAPLEVRA